MAADRTRPPTTSTKEGGCDVSDLYRFALPWGSVAIISFAVALGVTALSVAAFGDVMDDITRSIKAQPKRASSGLFDPESNRDAHHVVPGQRFILADLEGPGEIRHIWFTIASQDRRYPRSLVLRIYWDGSDVPSVESPIGDFFAAGNGMRAPITSGPIEVSSYGRALNSYWRMPFGRRARIEVHNQGPERMTVYFHCDWLKLDSLPRDTLYFHARYRQEYPAEPFSTYTIFDGKGEGQYVGTVFSSQNNLASWFGEADDRFYVDGEEVPSIIGTGTEDYFNDAWNLRLFTHQRRGVTICETKGEERRITAYRWHIDDPIPFRKSLKAEIERRSYIAIRDPETGRSTSYDFKYRPDYWSSVAYWYQKGIAEPFCELAPVEERILPEVWIEVANIIDQVKAAPGLEPRNAANRTCNLKRFFYLRNDEVGGWVEFPVTIPDEGRYSVSVFQSLFGEYGVWKVSLHGPDFDEILDPALDFYDHLQSRSENWPENFHHGTLVETKAGVRYLQPGDYTIRFECVGANPLSRHPETREFGQGYSLGLDALLFRRLVIDDPRAWMDDYLEKEEKLFADMEREARDTVATLADAVEKFRGDTGKYPPSLDKLISGQGSGTGYYDGPRIPLDPWGQPYRYRTPGEVNSWSFDVWSVRGNSRYPKTWIGNWPDPYVIEGAIEGEDLESSGTSEDASAGPQRTSSYGTAPISGGGLLFIRLDGPGAWVEIHLPEQLPPGRYEVFLFGVTSWDYGIVQWSLAGQNLGEPLDGHNPTIGRRALPRAVVDLSEGPQVLRAEAVGQHELSTGYYAGLDAIVLRRLR
jgi:hypothetical protein